MFTFPLRKQTGSSTDPISASPQRLIILMTHIERKSQAALGSQGVQGWDFPEATSALPSPAFLMLRSLLLPMDPQGTSGYGIWVTLPQVFVAENRVWGK